MCKKWVVSIFPIEGLSFFQIWYTHIKDNQIPQKNGIIENFLRPILKLYDIFKYLQKWCFPYLCQSAECQPIYVHVTDLDPLETISGRK